MTDTPLSREFRPDWTGFHRRLWRRWAMLLPLTLLVMVIAVGPRPGFLFLAIGLPMTLFGLGALLYFGRAKVWFEGPVVRIRGVLRTRSWSTADIGHLVFVPQPGLPGKKAPATLYAVTSVGERLFWLSGDVWERADQEEIAAHIGATVHQVPQGLTPKEIAERWPGTLGWTTLKPWLFALVIAGCALLLMLIVTAITAAVLIATGQVPLPAR